MKTENKAYCIDDIIEKVNLNEELTAKIRSYIMEEGHTFDDICGNVIAMADYYLELLKPDDCGFIAFHDFWLESSNCDESICKEIKRAVEKAKEENGTE